MMTPTMTTTMVARAVMARSMVPVSAMPEVNVRVRAVDHNTVVA